MSRSASVSSARRAETRSSIFPTLTLALWRLRQTWKLLLVANLGVIAAVMLACTVPLYSAVSMTAGLRGVLTSSAQSADVDVVGNISQVDPANLQQASAAIAGVFDPALGHYMDSPQFSLQSAPGFIYKPATSGGSQLTRTRDELQMVGFGLQDAAHHLTLHQGRLPVTTPGMLEIAITSDTAHRLNLHIGSLITSELALVNIPVTRQVKRVPATVVGIFDLPSTEDSFWHGFDFAPSDLGTRMSGPFGYQALASNDALLHYFGPISTQAQAQNLRFETPFSVAWYYRFDPQKVTISDLDTMISGLNTVQFAITNGFPLNAATSNLQHLQVNIPSDMLQNYHDQLPVAQVPIASLLVLVFALVIFFISMMANILVDRQSEAIAILRSRGADRRQIFGALVTQSSVIAVIAFLIGPLLAMGVVTLLSNLLLGSNSRGAGVLDLLAHDPRGMILTLLTYALMTTIFVLLAMLIALSLATRMDVLAMRRQAARTTHKPLWQRLNLDVVAVIVSLTCYGLSLYLTRSGILDPQLRLRLLTPVTLTGLVLLLLACILLFLRIFPMLLSLGSRLASRSRNASPILALGQMARSPRQSLRMTLLLALATAFMIFTLIFIASQSQRIESVSAYQVGADFSGVPDATSPTWQDFGQIAQPYSQMRGVLATSVGYSGTSVSSSATQSVDIEVRAPDADTFALAGSWSSQDSSQSLASLMALLRAQRASGISHKVIPAIVDDATWNLLNLSDGAHFVLGRTLGDTPVDFQVVGRVQHIPTVSDVSSDGSSAGGILVDYQTYAPVFTNDASRIGDSADVNYAWIKTTDNPILLSRLRRDLTSNFQANELLDRRVLAQSLRNEPIYLDLVGILAVGAITALLLALLGNLVASWLSAKTRLTNFAVLRALGAAPGQISSVLIWEQGIIYLTALVLGVLFGALLAALAVPALVYTNAAPTGMTSDPSNSAFFVSQSVPAIEVVVPLSLWIVLGVLIVICVLALWMMIRIVSRPSVSQTLRLNED